jgi:hypothetical protein
MTVSLFVMVVAALAFTAMSKDTQDEKQVVEIDFEFSGNTTGKPSAAFSEITGVSINKEGITDPIPGEDDRDDAYVTTFLFSPKSTKSPGTAMVSGDFPFFYLLNSGGEEPHYNH